MLRRLRNLTAPDKPSSPANESRTAVLAGKHITYTLKRSGKRRSIGLRIDHRGLTVSVPLRASESWLHEVLQHRADWVVEKLDGWQARQALEQCWADGETIPYLGELLTLRVMAGMAAATVLHGEELRLCLRGEVTPERIERKVVAWYRQQAMTLFVERVAHYAALLDVAPKEIRLTGAKTRWGSCTSRGTVRLNVQLVKLPHHLIDYVVVHELAHLREMNHSAAFWQVVAGVCPGYARYRSELKAVAL